MGDVLQFEDESGIERLVGTLHDPKATTGQVLTVQADKSIAAAPGGGGAAPDKWVRVPIAFDTPGLEAGLLVYTPPDNSQYLLDAWIEVDTGWDGTTPTGDLSTADPGDIAGTWSGFYNGIDSPQNMGTADSIQVGGPGVLQNAYKGSLALLGNATERVAPCRLTAAFPLYVCVSQANGSPGLSPGGAAGAGTVVLRIGTP